MQCDIIPQWNDQRNRGEPTRGFSAIGHHVRTADLTLCTNTTPALKCVGLTFRLKLGPVPFLKRGRSNLRSADMDHQKIALPNAHKGDRSNLSSEGLQRRRHPKKGTGPVSVPIGSGMHKSRRRRLNSRTRPPAQNGDGPNFGRAGSDLRTAGAWRSRPEQGSLDTARGRSIFRGCHEGHAMHREASCTTS